MNDVDIRTHEGTVTEAGHDMTLAVLVESVSDVPIPDVRPEFVTPVRWRPDVGARVRIFQRLGALHQSEAFTWTGLAPDIEDEEIVPSYMESGRIFILGEDGVLVLSLEDDADAITLPDGTTSATSITRVGREDASEPLMLGGVWRTKTRSILDEMIDAAQALADTAGALKIAADRLAAAVWPVAGAAASPNAADIVAFTGVSTTANTARTDATVAKNNLTTLKGELDEAYSTYAFTSRDAPRQT